MLEDFAPRRFAIAACALGAITLVLASGCEVDLDLGSRLRDAGADRSDAGGGDAGTGDGGGGDAGDGGAIATARQIAAGAMHTCAIVSGGGVKCWGANAGGQLGLGDTNDRGDGAGEMGAALPVTDLGPGAIAISVGVGFGHACALLDDGRVKCWGSNGFGQLGLDDGVNRGDKSGQMGGALPAVALGGKASALSVGFNHSCVILDDGRVKCWGINTYGQLGLGDKKDRGGGSPPMSALPTVDLGPGRTAKAISAGIQVTCAILDTGALKCWGFNFDGELGLGDTADRGDGAGEMGAALPTVDLGPGRTARDVAVGGLHACAVLDTGEVKCWGMNSSGELGRGDVTPKGAKPSDMGSALAALDLGPGRTAIRVQASSGSSCAILDDGSAKCWGRNGRGQLGIGDKQARGDDKNEMGAALLAIDLGPRVVRELSTVDEHVCALLDDKSLRCWGKNDRGQLGLGDVNDRGDGPGEMGAALPVVSVGP